MVCTPISPTTDGGGFHEIGVGKQNIDAVCTLLVSIADEKFYRFLRGLKDELRYPLILLRIKKFSELIKRARMGENDLAISLFRHDMSKKRSRDDITRRKINKKRDVDSEHIRWLIVDYNNRGYDLDS
ncbi:hypothetical protein IEQ34_009971 [Dendrobium chrysotoxum]|uniref:Uncharacterized protein n=1 Tax=Dendrobium chrysotoxum TaxID=161865 RepID=A0AAV7H1W3_DENCH|nr:hypothetical protein IEQ34_009971 [Dendrobium chrysotoxum]